MSWDILIFNSKQPVDFEKGDWPEFQSRQSLIERVKQTFPSSDWQDPSWGNLKNSECSIEFNIGDDEDIGNNFMLHVRGGGDPVKEIIRMCKQQDWIAFDISGNRYLDENEPSKSGFDDWQEYRDQVITLKNHGGNFGELCKDQLSKSSSAHLHIRTSIVSILISNISYLNKNELLRTPLYHHHYR